MSAGPAKQVAVVLAAAAIAVPLIAKFEGYSPVGYRDPAPGAWETICYGHRQDGALGKRLQDNDCADLLVRDATKHGLDISGCLPADVPVQVRAAFTSFAFNAGTGAFCSSSMSKRALAGNLPGACDALLMWTKAGGKELAGLVRRRREERDLCLSGLHPAERVSAQPKLAG